jgi:hypothetical protein
MTQLECLTRRGWSLIDYVSLTPCDALLTLTPQTTFWTSLYARDTNFAIESVEPQKPKSLVEMAVVGYARRLSLEQNWSETDERTADRTGPKGEVRTALFESWVKERGKMELPSELIQMIRNEVLPKDLADAAAVSS